MAHDDPDGLPPGHSIGRYRIERQLGRGGFGITYLARERRLGWPVAIKEYYPQGWASRTENGDVVPRGGNESDFDWGLQSFGEEAKILWRVRHPNIVRVHSYEEQERTGYIVMEFVEGESLSKRLERQRTLLEADIRQFVFPIMDGLAAVHDKGFLHLDIAPKNIMLTPDGRGVLLDFGAARPTQRAATGQATVLMTPSYAALEQHAETTQSHATDIYSLGAVLYRCVTGNPPWHPIRRVENDQMPRASDAEPRQAYSRPLLSMIDVALAVRSEDRPQHIADWQKLLSASDESEAGSESPRATDDSGRSDRQLAEEGNADAQYRLGCCYSEGSGVGRDDVASRFWFMMAAAQGHPRAQYCLHRMFACGVGVERNRSTADEWESKARQRDAAMQYRLAVSCREHGDDDEAAFWYRGAAHLGDVDAQYELGSLYYDSWVEGKIVGAAVEVSMQWCVERAAEGWAPAGVFLARGIAVGVAGGHREFQTAEREMRQLREEPGEGADAYWRADCATFCMAYKYLRMAARQQHRGACEFRDDLAVFMLKCASEERTWHGAFLADFASEVMAGGTAEAPASVEDAQVLDRFRLGCRVAYETIRADATIKDYESAVTQRLGCSKDEIRPYLRCWRDAAIELLPNHADAFAAIDTGDMSDVEDNADYQYERGLLNHYENDWEEAESWYTRAAEQGHAKAQFDLGMMYFHGEIEDLDIGECVEHAVLYCMDAAANGLDCAKAFLGRDIQAGLEAYRRGDHHQAELEFRRLAETGPVHQAPQTPAHVLDRECGDAQFMLAQMCVHRTISADVDDREAFDQAAEWLRGAARNGCARAESWLYGLLGGHARWWLNVEQIDLEDLGAEGMDWYWKAAERTPAKQYDLGLRSEGDPDHACREEASFWYRLAAEQGYVEAQFRLGLLTYCGIDGWHLEDSWIVDPEVPVRDLANVMLGSLLSAPRGQHSGRFPSPTDERLDGEGWLRSAARKGHSTAGALIVEGLRTIPDGPEGIDLFFLLGSIHPGTPSNVPFPDFAAEMQSESAECKQDPRLLAGLYRSYREAAAKADVSWASDFSTDAEIEAWYCQSE